MRSLLCVLCVVYSAQYVNSQISLTESGPTVVIPAQTLDVTCTVTGASLTDSNKLYSMEWVRQFPGKGLEWMGRIIHNGDLYYAQSLKGRITITRDVSKGIVFLKLSNVNVNDCGRYYCARYATGSYYAMDVWGQGTSVVVTSELKKFPQVFPLSPLGQEGNSFITIGCLAENYFPSPISVVWGTTTGDTLSGEKNIPFTISGDPLLYSLVSQITVSSSEWKSNNYSCEVKHFSSNIQKYIPKSCVSPPESPSVQILQGSCFSNNDDKIELSCQAYNLTSQEASIKWFKNGKETTIPQDLLDLGKASNNLYSLHSTVSIEQGEWNNGVHIKCQVTDPKTGKSSEATARKCSDVINCLGIEVIITPPTIEDIYIYKTARIPCAAYNLKQTDGYSFRFDYPGAPHTLDIQNEDPVLNQNGTFTVNSILTVEPETWQSNVEFTCIFSFPGLSEPIIRTISRKTEEKLMLPNAAVFPPPPEDLAKNEMCSLTCTAYGYYPETIFMGWLEGDTEVHKDRYINSGPKQNNRNQSFTSSSILIVPCSEWKEGTRYACVLGHEAIPMKIMTKPISIHSGNPAKVNVSVVMSDTTLSCHV